MFLADWWRGVYRLLVYPIRGIKTITTVEYAYSSDLMKAIRDLDVAGQVAVLDAFVDFYSKFPTSSSPHLCDRFCDDSATYRDYIDTTYDWMYLKRTLWSMEIIVDEMDITDPSNFFLLCSELDKVIKKQKKL